MAKVMTGNPVQNTYNDTAAFVRPVSTVPVAVAEALVVDAGPVTLAPPLPGLTNCVGRRRILRGGGAHWWGWKRWSEDANVEMRMSEMKWGCERWYTKNIVTGSEKINVEMRMRTLIKECKRWWECKTWYPENIVRNSDKTNVAARWALKWGWERWNEDRSVGMRMGTLKGGWDVDMRMGTFKWGWQLWCEDGNVEDANVDILSTS